VLNWRNAQPFEEGGLGFEGSGLGVRSRTVGSSPIYRVMGVRLKWIRGR